MITNPIDLKRFDSVELGFPNGKKRGILIDYSFSNHMRRNVMEFHDISLLINMKSNGTFFQGESTSHSIICFTGKAELRTSRIVLTEKTLISLERLSEFYRSPQPGSSQEYRH